MRSTVQLAIQCQSPVPGLPTVDREHLMMRENEPGYIAKKSSPVRATIEPPQQCGGVVPARCDSGADTEAVATIATA
jgi:hypothetical protein